MRRSLVNPFVPAGAAAVAVLLAGCAAGRPPRSEAPAPAAAAVAAPVAAPVAANASGGAAPAPAAADTTEWRAHQRRLAGFATAAGAADSVAALDFAALRASFARSSDYDPYGSDAELRKAMFDALGRSDFAGTRRLADSALAQNYLDIFAHVGAGAAAAGTGDTTREQFHHAVVRGLFEAIAATGDGTEAKPWVVLSVDEEYAVLEAQGLVRRQQSLSTCAGGRPCDILTVVPQRGGETRTLYFDVTLPKSWLTRRLEGK